MRRTLSSTTKLFPCSEISFPISEIGYHPRSKGPPGDKGRGPAGACAPLLGHTRVPWNSLSSSLKSTARVCPPKGCSYCWEAVPGPRPDPPFWSHGRSWIIRTWVSTCEPRRPLVAQDGVGRDRGSLEGWATCPCASTSHHGIRRSLKF